MEKKTERSPAMKRVDPKQAAAAYIRVSSEPQADEEKSSLTIQKEAIQRYADDHNLIIYGIYEDHESGKRVDRTNYLRMKKDALAGHFKKVIFHKWDRFGRNTKEILNVHDELKEIGVDIVCVSQGVDTSTAHGRFFMTNLAAFAELELSQIRDRTIQGLKARAKKGLRIGMAPFGYHWDEDKGKFEIDPDESKIYKRMIHDYLVKGKSQIQIAVDLNKEGIKSSYGRKWTQISVSVILSNPAYKGTFRYSFQGEEVEVPCPRLIDPKKWDLIQARAQENKNKSKNYNKVDDPFLLRNLIKCGECGYGLAPEWVRSRDQTWRYYQCHIASMNPNRRNASNVKKTCFLPSIPAEKLEQEVLSEIKTYFTHPKKIVSIYAKQTDTSQKAELENKLKGSKIKLGKFQAKKNEYFTLFNEDGIDKEELIKQERSLKDSIEKLKENITETEKELNLIEFREEDLKRLTSTAKEMEKLSKKIQEAFEKMTHEQLKGFLKEALAGEKLRVRILRNWDVQDDTVPHWKLANKSLLTDRDKKRLKQLNEPLIDTTRPGPKTFATTVDFGWMFDLEAASQYLKPLVKLNNSR